MAIYGHDVSTINTDTGIASARIASTTDVLIWCDRHVCLSVCLLITPVSPAKMAEPIEMLFGVQVRVGQRNHYIWAPLDKYDYEQSTGCSKIK